MATKKVSEKKKTTQTPSGTRTRTRKQATPAKTTRKTTGKTGNRTKNDVKQQSIDFPMTDEIILWLVLALSIIILLSNFGLGGFIGSAVSSFFFGLFGFPAYILPFLLFLLTGFLISNKKNQTAWIKAAAGILLWICICTFFELVINGYEEGSTIMEFYANASLDKSGGGLFGGILCRVFCPAIGVVGTYVIVIILMLVSIIMITERSMFEGMKKHGRKMYESASSSRKYHAEKARVRRDEQDIERQKKMVEARKRIAIERDELEEMKEALPEEIEAIRVRRLEKKVSGVNLETIVGDGEPGVPNIHEIMPANPVFADALPEQAEVTDETETTESVEPVAHVPRSEEKTQLTPEFEIVRGGASEDILDEDEDNHDEELLDMDEFPEITEIQSSHKRKAEQTKPSEMPKQDIQPETTEQAGTVTKRKKYTSEAEQKEGINEVAKQAAMAAEVTIPEYVFPPIDLLNKPKRGQLGDSDEELKNTAAKLQNTLHSFGVEVHITNVSCGPAVTRYELTPEQGVKVSRIVNLADDIKLNLAAADIRIEAPIPGKAAVGIEVPNKENSAVMLRELLESKEFREHPSNLAFAAGKDISGKVLVTDIAKMPHLLIAGATGSGKSVCINTIIMSILYKAKPEDVKLIMIDPKVVELSVYNGIPHLFIPVVTDPKKAAGALNWAVAEMTDRYKKFADVGVRNLQGYNKKVEAIEDIEDEEKPKKMPQIVIIVDELADLMMVAPGDVEDAICRLAQLARAAGIHLIIATQRPSVNVITGLIKANMPSRIAFAVSSGVDSRTIIDMNGAEKLLGKGDMLFYPQGYQKPARVQGAFVSDKEVAEVVDYLTQENSAAAYSADIEDQISKVQQAANSAANNGGDVDEYFTDAGKFIIEKDKASIGMLQRMFKIGFNRAARIMDQLADAGVVGEEEGTKPRKVLMSMEEFENYLEQN